MIAMEDVKPVEVEASIPAEQAAAPSNSLKRKRPEGEGAVEIYCTKCGESATDGRFSPYGPSMEWWYTITGTLDEIQWVYQTDKNYWAKVVEPTVRCGCGSGRECNPMLWSVRRSPQARRRALRLRHQRLMPAPPLVTKAPSACKPSRPLRGRCSSARCIWIRI